MEFTKEQLVKISEIRKKIEDRTQKEIERIKKGK